MYGMARGEWEVGSHDGGCRFWMREMERKQGGVEALSCLEK